MFSINDLRNALHQGEYERGLAMCKSLLFDKRDDFMLLSYFGAFLLKLERYNEAIKVFDKLLTRAEDEIILDLRGDCYYGQKKNELALKDYLRVIKIDKDINDVYDKIARTYYRIGSKKRAYEYIDKAITRSADGGLRSLKNKAVFLRFDGRTAESFKLLTELREKYPSEKFFRNELLEIIEEALVTKKS